MVSAIVGLSVAVVGFTKKEQNAITLFMIKNKMNQDNPFAKGVSINQDMLTEEWQDAIDNGRVSLIHKGPGLILSKESELLQQEWENRKLLALGREEE